MLTGVIAEDFQAQYDVPAAVVNKPGGGGPFLGISILTLSFVGVYSLRNNAIDCAIAGVFGLILKRLNLPIVPIILGMVLGGIMEAKLRTPMMRVKMPLDFIDRPIAFILFLTILVVLATHFWTLAT